MAENVTARIDLDVRGGDAADRAAASLQRLVDAEGGAVVVSEKLNKVRESSAAGLEKLAKRYDADYRRMQQYARDQETINKALNSGLAGTLAYERGVAGLNKHYEEMSRISNDNSRIDPFGHATEGASRFSRSLEGVRSFAWNNSSFSGDQIDRVILPIQTLGNSLGALPAIAIAAGAAVEGALTLIGARAQSALADLQEVSSKSGLGVNTIAGAQIVGARAGLTQDATRSAFENAGSEYDKYRRNSGSVKDELDAIDEGFLKVADRARSAGEFIDTVEQKIRALPRDEGIDLSKALFGDDAGARLFDSVRSGALSMRSLGDEAARAGGLNDELARHAADVQKQIDEASEVARTKLLVAFQDLGSPIDNLKLGWWNVVGSIGDAITRSEELRQIMQGLMHPIDTLMSAPKTIGNLIAGQTQPDRPIGRLIDLQQQADFGSLKNQWMLAGPKVEFSTAGDVRKRFEDRAKEDDAKSTRGGGRSAGLSDADRAAERYTSITRQLQGQLSLLGAQGDEHDRLALKLQIEKEQIALGTGATELQKRGVADLVTKIDEATKAQQRLNEGAKAFNDAYGSAARSLSSGIKDIIKGGSPLDALNKSLTTLQDYSLDAILTGSGPFAKLAGTAGKDGATGGVFGGLADAFGLNAKTTSQMNVQAAVVNLSGGIGGGLGGVGSLLGLGRNANFAGQAAGAIGPFEQAGASSGGFFDSIGSSLSSLFSFRNGGVMTSAGALPLHRYASGGIASSPQLALFGEGRGPEAFVPLPDGRSIPVNMRTPAVPQMNFQAPAPAVAPVTVNVHNAPQGTQVKESTDAKGNRRIDVVINERVAAGMASPQGRDVLSGMGARQKLARY